MSSLRATLGEVPFTVDDVDALARAPARLVLSDSARGAGRAARLMRLKGLGQVGAMVLSREVFYRHFDNRREVASYFGLTPSPYNSGGMRSDQGIGKAGNSRARTLAIELAWLWISHQPGSTLTHWFLERVATATGRIRRIAIVALARKLMIAIWRYLTSGMIPQGAVMKPI